MSDDVTRKSVDRPTSTKRLEHGRWGRQPFYFGSWYGDPTTTLATAREIAAMSGGKRADTPAA